MDGWMDESLHVELSSSHDSINAMPLGLLDFHLSL